MNNKYFEKTYNEQQSKFLKQESQKKSLERLSFKQRIAHLVKNNKALMSFPFIKHFVEKQVNTLSAGETQRENTENTKGNSAREDFINRLSNNGKYRNLPPVYTKGNQIDYMKRNQDEIVFYHGGADSNMTIEDIDILKLSEKQQKDGTNYAGFYMYSEKNKESAIRYAKQENDRKGTKSKGILKISLDKDLREFKKTEPFSITRISQDEIKKLQEQGYDIISGKVLTKTEYVLINKSKIKSVQFEDIKEIENDFVR